MAAVNPKTVLKMKLNVPTMAKRVNSINVKETHGKYKVHVPTTIHVTVPARIVVNV